MVTDAFSNCHPAVNFIFFAGAIGCGMLLQHPVYLLAGVLCGGVYYWLLAGRKALRAMGLLLPFALLLALVNPLFNVYGATPLLYIAGRPYTAEALLYGGVMAAVFYAMMHWFGCYNAVMTGDKFTSLFGNLIPSISLILVMVFRLVPGLLRKTRQISGARDCIGKGTQEADGPREKLTQGMTVLSAMTSWALEGSLVTGDSMRSRGYGTGKHQSFMLYRMTARDWGLLAAELLLLALVAAAAALGQAEAVFTPAVSAAPLSWGAAAYTLYLLIPTVLHIKEAVQWHISRSGI